MSLKILIGTPAYDGQVTSAYHSTMVDVIKHLERSGVESESRVLGTTYIHWARNALATHCLQEPSFTHLLFVDADMGFRRQLIGKMIALDQPIVGCVYPLRYQSYDRLFETAASFGGVMDWRFSAQRYVGAEFVTEEGGKLRVRNGFVRTRTAGTGVMLVKREALERLSEAYPELWSDDEGGIYRRLGVLDRVFQPFDPFKPEGGLLLGEDVAFCRRWLDRCDGEIWCCIDETVRHVGREVFVGNYERVLANRKPATPAA